MHRVSVPFLTALLLLFVPVFGHAQLPTPAGPILKADSHPAAPYLDPDTFVAPGGDYVRLTWEPEPDPEGFPALRLMGQRFSADGAPLGEAFAVDTQVGSPADRPGANIGYQAGVFLTEDRFAIVWATFFGCCEPELYLRFFQGDGVPTTAVRRISNADFIDTLSMKRLDDATVAVLATYDGSFPQTLHAHYGVFGVDGSVYTSVQRVGKEESIDYSCEDPFGETVLGADLLPDGDLLITFFRRGSNGPQPGCQEYPSGLFFRQVSPRGEPRGPEMRFADVSEGSDTGVSTLVPGVGWLVLLHDYLRPYTEARWFSVDGTPLSPPFEMGTELSQQPTDLAISTPPNGDILVSWNRGDFRLIPISGDRLVRALEVPCTPGPTTLCLEGGRFRADVDWADFRDREGSGSGEPLSDETGYFTFFNPENVELVVKVLDGSANNGNFWVFYGALSNVEYRLTVTDTENTLQKVYRNPPRNFASVGDTGAFPAPLQAPPTQSKMSPAELASLLPNLATDGPGLATAGESGTDLTFQDGRFRASVTWRDFQDRTGVGQGATLTDDTGYFWFFRPENIELVVKVLDGRANNGNWWVFYGALSNVEYTLTVEDTENSTTKSYFNPLRTFASAGDTEAFPE